MRACCLNDRKKRSAKGAAVIALVSGRLGLCCIITALGAAGLLELLPKSVGALARACRGALGQVRPNQRGCPHRFSDNVTVAVPSACVADRNQVCGQDS